MSVHSPIPAVAAAGPDLVSLAKRIASADAANKASPDLVDLAGGIASAYVAHNAIPAGDLPLLLHTLHGALHGLAHPPAGPRVERASAAQVAASIRPDALVSFEDGLPYKALRRHLTLRGLTPEAYRAKWGLPPDYPMTSAAYSERRSAISRAIAEGARAPAAAGVAA